VVEVDQIPTLFTIYGAGYVAIFAIYGALYLHARRNRAALELSPFEAALTNAEVAHHAGLCAVGLVAIALARLLPVGLSGLSGFAYVLIGLVETWHGARESRLRLELAGRTADPGEQEGT
jgi:hypothetical protein